MDTRHSTLPELIGTAIGATLVLLATVSAASLILLASWNRCVPQVFGLSELTFAQSFAMIGVTWTLTASIRVRA